MGRQMKKDKESKPKVVVVHHYHTGTVVHRRESRREAYNRELVAHILARRARRITGDF